MTSTWKGICAAAVICAATAAVDAGQQQAAGTRREPQFENNEVRGVEVDHHAEPAALAASARSRPHASSR